MPSQAISSQIADMRICFILYNMLFIKTNWQLYTTEVYLSIIWELREKNSRGESMGFFKELLRLIIDHICLEYGPIKSYKINKIWMFKYVKKVTDSL
jgi:hypothetical protein